MLLEGLLAVARPGAALEIRLNAQALREAGYTLKSGGARVGQALINCGFEVVGDLLWLDARELRRCPTNMGQTAGLWPRPARRGPEGNAQEQ